MCIITATAISTAIGVSSGIASALAVAGNVALAVGTVASVAGTALGAVGSYQQGKAQAAAYEYQAQVNRENAKIANENAALERQAGLEEARRQRIATLQTIGKQKVSLAANGVDVGYGTSLDIIEDSAMMGELDALMIETEAERRARNYEIQSNNFLNDANLSSFAARNARTAGNIGTFAGGLNTIGRIGTSVGGGLTGIGGGLGNLGSKSGLRLSGGFDISNSGIISNGILGA